jgi:hypothetical protein
MICSIDREADVNIYFHFPEIEKLCTRELSGTLIFWEKPKRQGTLFISCDNQKSVQNGYFGIGIDDSKYWGVKEDFILRVFLNDEWYNLLKERKATGTRHRMLNGSKITLYNRSKLREYEELAPSHLEFYRDNKSRLRSELG